MSGWSPVVYGRTRAADIWWRALPAGIGTEHWVAAAVTDTVAGGAGLVRYRDDQDEMPENTPRFVLARDTDGTLIGLACRARALSSELCQDQFGREIYCFVGWFTADPRARDIPAIEDLFPAPGGWASQVYERYSAPVWTAEPLTLTIQRSAPDPALQPHPSGRPEGGGELRALKGRVRVYPAVMADQLWGYGSESDGPFLLVTGWQLARQASLERITHLSAGDVTEPTTAPRPLPRPEPERVVSERAAQERAARERAAASDSAVPEAGRQDSHLAATSLARQYEASQRQAGYKAEQSSSSVERFLAWLLHLFNQPSQAPRHSGKPVQRPASRPGNPPSDRTTAGPASTATGPDGYGTTPDAPRSPAPPPPPPPPEIELPARRDTAKPFEGLE